MNNIYFITGTSGSGKSTLTHYLKRKLPDTLFDVHNFDESSMPTQIDEQQRKKQTDYWLARAQENNSQGKSTVICGLSVPSDILESAVKPPMPIYFGFIKIDDYVIKERLSSRKWDQELIEKNISWAHQLEQEVKKQERNYVVKSSEHTTAEQVANVFAHWILQEIHHE